MSVTSRAPLELSARRRQILDAAVSVLATQGWRGLTHRAIDRAAGLPEGSSSAYYRSRSALQAAMAEYVVWQLAADVETLAAELDQLPGDHDHAVAATSATFRRWLDESALLTARLELTLAAARDDDHVLDEPEHVPGVPRPAAHRLEERPADVGQLRDSRQSLTMIVDDIMARGGHAHSGAVSATIVAALDGVLISALLRPAAQRAAFVTDSLDLLFGALVEGRPTQ